MKQKVVLWVEERHVGAITTLAQQENRTMSSAACVLLDKALATSPDTSGDTLRLLTEIHQHVVPKQNNEKSFHCVVTPAQTLTPTITAGSNPRVQAMAAKVQTAMKEEELVSLEDMETQVAGGVRLTRR